MLLALLHPSLKTQNQETMDTKQPSNFLSISKGNRQLQQSTVTTQNDDIPPPPQRGLNLSPVWRLFKRKAPLIIGITSLATAAGWVLGMNSASTYLGNFRLLVEPATNEGRVTNPSVLTRLDRGVPKDEFSLDYPTQVEILKSSTMLSGIADRVQTQYPKFSQKSLEKGLTVQRIGESRLNQTKIIEVAYQDQDPKLVELVLAVTSDKYLRYSLQERKSRISEGIKFIEEQLPVLQKRVGYLQSRLQKLQQRYKINAPDDQGKELYTEGRQIAQQQSEIQRLLDEQTRLYANLKNQLKLTPNEAMAASALSENPRYTNLLTKIKEVEVSIATESSRFSSNSPTLENLLVQRQNLLSLLNEEKQQILGQNITAAGNNPQVLSFQNPVRLNLIKQLIDTANQVQVLQVRKQAIDQTRNTFELQAQQFPTIALEYNELQRQLNLATQTLNQLLTQRETLRVEAAQKQVPWELVSQPQIPTDANGNPIPDKSDGWKKILLGAILGLGLGTIAALILEKYQNVFYGFDDIKDAVKLPVLGSIPFNKKLQKLAANAFNEPIRDSVPGNNTSSFIEAFDSLYANVRFSFSEQVRSIAICSAVGGEGKSTIALQLAQSAAAMGQRVLLVDANLYRPQLHNKLELPNSKGLSEILSHQTASHDFIQHSPITSNLFLLTAGQLSKSNKLLGSNYMQSLMKEFESRFDLVIYDTPNLNSCVEVSFLAAHTDVTLMVVGVGKSERSVVMKVIDKLKKFNLPNLGIVVNHPSKNTASSPQYYQEADFQKKLLPR